MFVVLAAMLRGQILHLLFNLSYFGNMLSWREDMNNQLRLKAVEMLYSSTHLAKNHGDDLGLEYL